jgi:signal transduction histidine kinase
MISREIDVFYVLLKSDEPQAEKKLAELNKKLNAEINPVQRSAILGANSYWYLLRNACDSALAFGRRAAQADPGRGQIHYNVYLVASAYRCASQFDSAMANYITAEKLAIANRDTAIIIRANLGIGYLLSELNKYSEATKYFQRAYRIGAAFGQMNLRANTVYALASNLQDLGQNKESIPYMQSALDYFKREHNLSQEAIIYNNLATMYKHEQNFRLASHYYKQSLEINKQLNRQHEVAREYNNIASVMISENEYTNAIPLLLQAEKMYSELDIQPALPNIYLNLAQAYSRTGDYAKAYHYKQAEKNLSDSLKNIELLKNTQRLQEEFEAEKRQLEINNLKQENEVKELQANASIRQRNLFIVLAGALLCMGILVFFIYRQRARNARQVNEKNILIHRQQMEEVLRKSELQSIHNMIETQEKERKRIAEDLHDRVGSMLSTIKLQFGRFKKKDNNPSSELYTSITQLIDEACEEIRRVSHNLVSGVLSTFGLVPALNDLARALRQSNQLDVEIKIHGMDARLKSETEINIYRIFQELFNNTIRHSGANRVDIDINRFGNELSIIYSDNGKGFDQGSITNPGIGLKSIYSRVDKLGGSVHIDSGQGNGCTFVFSFDVS